MENTMKQYLKICILAAVVFCLIGCAPGEKESGQTDMVTGIPENTAATLTSGESDYETAVSAVEETETEKSEADAISNTVEIETCYKYKIEKNEISENEIDHIMYALFVSEEERNAYQNAGIKNVKVDGEEIQQPEMTVEGIKYTWMKTSQGLLISSERKKEGSIGVDTAKELALDFVRRLEWDLREDLEVRSYEKDEVILICRLCYDNIKVMGEHNLFFEQRNENEIPLSGSYIKMTIVESGIQEIEISTLPQITEQLESYQPAKDFLSADERMTYVTQYFTNRKEQFSTFPEYDLSDASSEMIYMPFKDTRLGEVYIPAFEIVVKDTDRSFGEGILYMDAITGYIYDMKIR